MWQINTYTVTYNYTENGGTSATKTSASVNYGSTIDLTPTATKSGYTFVGWNTNKNGTSKLSSLTMGTSNVTLYAIYSKTVTATCYYYSGTAQTSKKVSGTMYNKSTTASVNLGTTSLTGYTFRGWSTSNSGSATIAVASNGSVGLSSNATYYACYSYTVTGTYKYYNGTAYTSSTATATAYMNSNGTKVGGKPTAPTVSNPSGWTARGWSKSSVATTANILIPGIITENTTYYYSWKKDVIGTYYYYNGSSYTNSTSTANAYMSSTGSITGGKPTAPTVSNPSGWTARGWSKSTEANTSSIVTPGTITENTTYYYSWKKTITVSYDANGGTGAPDSQTTTGYLNYAGTSSVPTAITISSTKPTRANYVFSGWGTTSSSTSVSYNAGSKYSSVTSSTLYAIWTPNVYKISLDNTMGTYQVTFVAITQKSNIKQDENKGVVISTVQVPWGGNATAPDVISSHQVVGSGVYAAFKYSFKNWDKSFTNVRSDLVVYASYTVEIPSGGYSSYTVSCSDIPGEVTATQTSVYEKYNTGIYRDSDCSQKITETSNKISIPNKSGYEFCGYYTGKNGTGTKMIDEYGYITENFKTTQFNSNGILYAYWVFRTYEITYKNNSNTIIKHSDSLEEALSYSNTSTIKMYRNATENKQVTVESGKTIILDMNNKIMIGAIKNEGTLTTQNGGQLKSTSIDETSYKYILDNEGTLTLNNLDITSSIGENRSGALYNAGTATVNTGTISKLSDGWTVDNRDVLNLNDATVALTLDKESGGGTALYNTSGTLNINNGTINSYAYGLVVDGGKAYVNTLSVTIKGIRNAVLIRNTGAIDLKNPTINAQNIAIENSTGKLMNFVIWSRDSKYGIQSGNIYGRVLATSNVDTGKSVETVTTYNVDSTNVVFPVWTSYNSQDDIEVNRISKSGNAHTVTIYKSNHNNESGHYYVDIYTADSSWVWTRATYIGGINLFF